MRKLKIYPVLALMAAALLSSCNAFLDTDPDNRTSEINEENVAKLLVSAYPESAFHLMCEIASDNTDDCGTRYTNNNRLQQYVYEWKDPLEITQDTPFQIWESHYMAITTANKVLLEIEKMGNPENLDPYRGEALLCRAYSHFVLVNMFCNHYGPTSNTDLGIPFMTDLATTVSPQYSRTTVARVYQRINDDIEDGLPLVAEGNDDKQKYHFTKLAAYAFAARFNLYYEKWDKVIEYANVVLGSDRNSIQFRDWSALNELSPNEDQRGYSYISAGNPANLLLSVYYSLWPWMHGPTSIGPRYAHSDYIATNETTASKGPWGDEGSFRFTQSSYSSIPKVIQRKLYPYFEYVDVIANTGKLHMVSPLFTTEETLLCRAEAYVIKKNYREAMLDLNAFTDAYFKEGASPITTASVNEYYESLQYYTSTNPTPKKAINPAFSVEAGLQENMIHYVLHLRRILTVHEGLRWFDIKRYGIEITRRQLDAQGQPHETDILRLNDPRRAFQLPLDVIDAGMTPNPR